MIKVGICKIWMLGERVLVLGIGRRYEEGDEYWSKYQLFTMESYLNCQYTYVPPSEDTFCSSMYKSQEECDVAAAEMREAARNLSRYHGTEVHFENLNRVVPITQFGHDFNFNEAQCIEITRDELKLLEKDLRGVTGDYPNFIQTSPGWMDFDLESWGK